MLDIDALVHDKRFLPYHGWHDPLDLSPNARPAIQQNREEFLEFVGLLNQRERCVQVGLGYPGASHFVLSSLFDQAWTIDLNASCTEHFSRLFGERGLILGDSHDPKVRSVISEAGPLDLLFIDGDKSPEGLRADYYDYEPFVRAGGVVAFHDTIPYEGSESTQTVAQFMSELKAAGLPIHQIGYILGISYFVKGAQA